MNIFQYVDEDSEDSVDDEEAKDVAESSRSNVRTVKEHYFGALLHSN